MLEIGQLMNIFSRLSIILFYIQLIKRACNLFMCTYSIQGVPHAQKDIETLFGEKKTI